MFLREVAATGAMLGAFRISLTPTRPYESGNEFPIRRSSNTKLIANTQLQMGVIAKSKGTESRISTVCRATSFLTASLPTIRASRKNRMQLRHAAALALVGWYLMTPPLLCRSGTAQECPNYANCKFCRSDSQTPLREWVREPDTKEFEYKTDCQRAISDGCHSEVDADGTTSLGGDLCGADCIAADDPRLKKK
jgi:hypothetical protein